MKTQTLTLPASWATVLINNDRSGTSARDLAMIDQLKADYPELGEALSCSEEEEITRWHDAPSSIGQASCLEFTFPVIGNAQ